MVGMLFVANRGMLHLHISSSLSCLPSIAVAVLLACSIQRWWALVFREGGGCVPGRGW